MTALYMGIDGGGSNLRVIICNEHLESLAEAYGGTANPSVIGHSAATALIQAAMHEAIAKVESPIAGVGIGIAGAPAEVAHDWLAQTVLGVTPQAYLAAASDNEIALVGALGKREGLLLLAGTGSVGFGINALGESLQVGGWGYLIADEGSGYWLGMHALRLVTQALDGRIPPSDLTERVCQAYAIKGTKEVLDLVYHTEGTYTPRIAKIAPLVLESAAVGDSNALALLESASAEIVVLADLLKRRLNMPQAEIVLAGSLLVNENHYRNLVIQKLGLATPPIPRHSPVVGAALLAKLLQQGV